MYYHRCLPSDDDVDAATEAAVGAVAAEAAAVPAVALHFGGDDDVHAAVVAVTACGADGHWLDTKRTMKSAAIEQGSSVIGHVHVVSLQALQEPVPGPRFLHLRYPKS